MKIGTSKTVGGQAAVAANAVRFNRAPPSMRVVDSFGALGIPDAEFTPTVRSALATLLAEVEHLRRETEVSRSRIALLEKLADEDPLASVANRRAFVRELSRMMAFSERYGAPSSLLYFDIDNMKTINDAFGHAAGDAAIRFVADTLMANVRESDTVGRLGGDEFAVVLVETAEPAAHDKGAQLARAIEQGAFSWQAKAVPLSITFGAFSFAGGLDALTILDEADRAMYAKKQADRGRLPR